MEYGILRGLIQTNASKLVFFISIHSQTPAVRPVSRMSVLILRRDSPLSNK